MADLPQQSLYEKVNEIAARFPESEGRASYVAAAKDFRIPYWDWAAVLDAGTEFVPTSLSSKQLKIVGPESKGMPDLVDNPLYSFKFHPINPRPGDFPKAKVRLISTNRYAQYSCIRHFYYSPVMHLEYHL